MSSDNVRGASFTIEEVELDSLGSNDFIDIGGESETVYDSIFDQEDLNIFEKYKDGEMDIPDEFEDYSDLIEFWKVSGMFSPDYEEFDDLQIFPDDHQWLNAPYSYKTDLFSIKDNDKLYYVNEPDMTDYEFTVKEEIENKLRRTLMYKSFDPDKDRDDILVESVEDIVEKYGLDVDRYSMLKILYYLRRDFVYYGKIDPLMYDPDVEDISCDGVDVPLFVYHQKNQDMMTNIKFENEDKLDSFVTRLAQKSGQHISVAKPLVDADTPDGSRIQLGFQREVTPHGSTFTLRKFSEEPFTPIDLINFNTFSVDEMAYLWTCIENNKSLIFAGGTASGKTTSMNAVSMFIPPKNKIVSIEDTRELTLPHMNWIPQVTRDSFSEDKESQIDEYKLLETALRQRPEYIIVGEVRGDEAITLFQAMSTGHTTYSTMHADSVGSAIHRLVNPPINVPRTMLKSLDIVCIQTKTFVEGDRVRRNNTIEEFLGVESGDQKIRTDNIFEWDPRNDEHVRSGNSEVLKEIKKSKGWTDRELDTEITNRRKVLNYMLENDINDYVEVASIIQGFITDPSEIMEKIEKDTINPDELRDSRSLLPNPDDMRG